MDAAAPIQVLTLAVILEVEQLPIAGMLRHGEAAPERFDGWLELIAAIESALTAARSDPRPPQPGGRP